MIRSLAAWLIVVLALAHVHDAQAFHTGKRFEDSPGSGGAGRIYYTGRPSQRGWDCAMCHTQPAGKIWIELDVDSDELKRTRRYRPATKYRFTVSMRGEHRGLGAGISNHNGMALELVDGAGIYAGVVGGFDANEIYSPGKAVLATGGSQAARSQWSFEWTSPKQPGTGTVSLYLGVVDGNGADSDPTVNRTDPFGDDLVMAAMHFDEERATGAASALTILRGRTNERRESMAGLMAALVVTGLLACALAARRLRGGVTMRRWLLIVPLAGGVSALVNCGEGASEAPSPCPTGICFGGGGNPANTTGGNPTAGQGGATSSGNASGGSPGCIESWFCTPWQTNGSSDSATRTCTDAKKCGSTSNKPIEQVVLPALDEHYYRCQVEPVFDRLCSQLACHGTEPDPNTPANTRALRIYHRGRLRFTGGSFPPATGCFETMPKPSEKCTGSIECSCWTEPHLPIEWRRNYDSARGFALDSQGKPLANVDGSDMLKRPLIGAGLPHAGMYMWRATDKDYQTVRAWLAGAKAPQPCTTTN
jgi:hypothetical protein